MIEPEERYASFDDILSAPEAKVAEILGGMLHLSPRRACREIAAAGALLDELGLPFKRGKGGPGGWLIVDQPVLRLRRDVVVPDLAGWRRDRLAKLPDSDFVRVAPDWVCEILAPETRKLDRIEKKPIYAAHGIKHLWLVDPLFRILETRELVDGRWTDSGNFADDALVRAAPFEATELELGALWADVEPPRDLERG